MNERDFDLAEERTVQERETMIARTRAQLIGRDEENCIQCGDPIDVARRIALPSATRCVECQGAHERQQRSLGANA